MVDIVLLLRLVGDSRDSVEIHRDDMLVEMRNL
jgi:hypothetical protein